MKFLKIKETCLYIKNLERARTFYEEVLELPLISYVPGKHAFFKAGSSVLLLFNPDDSREKRSPPSHYGEGKQHVAFEVPSSQYVRAKEWILSKGIILIEEVTWLSGMKSIYFEDSEGNVLEILPDQGIWPD